MRQLRSRVDGDGTVRLSVDDVPVPELRSNDVLVKVDAAPINPSDLAVLLCGGNADAATDAGDHGGVRVPLAADRYERVLGRVGRSIPGGTEGAGVVVAAGDSPQAQALLGSAVAVVGSGTFAEFAAVPWGQCLALPDGLPAQLAASAFVNPLTALGMVDTMRAEGHTAMVHTAAASALGQMLVRLCAADGIPLVNVVRRPEQAELLRALGAEHVVDSSRPTFEADLVTAMAETGATLGFDAVGGTTCGTLLSCMEAALSRGATDLGPYGTSVRKQVYVYGLLDDGPMVVTRDVGMAWSVGGWLLDAFLRRAGIARIVQLRERVLAELTTTFATHYTREITLDDVVSSETIRSVGRLSTGQKFLLRPWGGVTS